jgi:hypothetical protein
LIIRFVLTPAASSSDEGKATIESFGGSERANPMASGATSAAHEIG